MHVKTTRKPNIGRETCRTSNHEMGNPFMVFAVGFANLRTFGLFGNLLDTRESFQRILKAESCLHVRIVLTILTIDALLLGLVDA